MRFSGVLLKTTSGNALRAMLVLFAGLLLTLLVTGYIVMDVRKTEVADMQQVCSDIQSRIATRLDAHAQLLRCGAALFATKDHVSRGDWRAFYEKSHIEKNLPGILGLGYAEIVQKKDLQQHLESVRAEGFSKYQIFPAGDRGIYSTVIYLEPFSGRNLRAFGYDMLSETVRRRALEICRDSNTAELSGKVRLVQETNRDVQAGTLMFVPVYKNGYPINTVRQRQEAILGWVYSPYRMNDLMAGILGRRDTAHKGQLRLQIYDNAVIQPEALLYDSRLDDPNAHLTDDHKNELVLPVDFHGKRWTLVLTQTEGFHPLVHSKVIIVFVCGLIISILLFILALSLFNTQFRAQQIARQLTAELKESEERWKFALEGTSHGVWDWDMTTNRLFVSPQWKEILGVRNKDLTNTFEDWSTRVHPEDVLGSLDAVQLHVEGKASFYANTYRIRCSDGSYKWVMDRGKIMGHNKEGQPVRMIGTITDMTEHIEAEKLLEQTRTNYETFFNAIDDFLFVLDEQGNIIHANATVIDRLGYTKEELDGKSVLMVHPPERREEAGRIVGEMLTGQTEFCPVPVITKSGMQIPVETRIAHGFWDGKPVLFGVTKDISQLRLSEEKFSKLFYINPSACGLSELDSGRYIEVNQVFYNLFGFNKEEVIGKTAMELGIMNPEAREIILKNADAQGNVYNVEAALITKSGEKKHVLLSAENIFVQDKKYRFTVVHDITSRKQVEEELYRSNKKLEAIVLASPDGIGMISMDGKLQLVSDKLAEIYGYDSGDKEILLGQSVFNFIEASYHNLLSENIKKLLTHIKNQKVTEYMGIRKDGSRFFCDVNSTILLDANGIPENILFIERDITERKIAEATLNEASMRLSLATRAGGVGIWDYDVAHDKVLWDDQMFLLYGMAKVEMSFQPDSWFSIMQPDDASRIRDEVRMAIAGIKEFNSEFRVVRPDDGSIRTMRAMAVVKRDENSDSLHMIGTNWDITEQKKVEEALIKAKQDADNANKAKSEFLANMSHEIRTPMNAILGFSEALYNRVELRPYQKMIKSILNSGNLLLSLLNDILDLSKIEAGKLDISIQPVNLDYVVQEIILLFKSKAQSRGIELKSRIEPDFPVSLMLDEIRIKQILFNLVGNAIKFTHKGFVNIDLSFMRAGEQKGTMQVVIEDTGIGIPESQQDLVFEAFRQQTGQSNRLYGGTGLGLTITKRLVEKMDGTIHVNSEVGKGSTFVLMFPEIKISSGRKRRREYFEEIQHVTFDPATILVVDDVDCNTEAVESLLASSGLNILSARDGEVALEILKHTSPALILLDVRMPGMDGYEIVKRIKSDARGSKIPVIAYTASVMSSDKIEGNGSFDGYLYKPVKRVELYNLLMKFLKHSTEAQKSVPEMGEMHVHLSLSPDLKKKIPEMIRILQQDFLPKWQGIKDTLVLFKIDAFADDLLNLARKEGFDFIANYASRIKEDVNLVDLDSIRQSLHEFPEILENLKKYIHK
jgi:PAS domain S-box-containing protein